MILFTISLVQGIYNIVKFLIGQGRCKVWSISIFYFLALGNIILRMTQFCLLFEDAFCQKSVLIVGEASVIVKMMLGIVHAHNLQTLIVELRFIKA